MRRTLAIAVCGSLLMVACATSSEETDHSPTTTPLVAPSTVPDVTVPTATTATVTADFFIDYEGLEAFKVSTTSTTVPNEPSVPSAALDHAPKLLVAHRDGIDLWTPESVTPVLRGRDVGVAFPDLAGGVIFSTWDDEQRPVIERIPLVGDDPEVLITDPDAIWLHPTQVTYVMGRPALIYRKIIELPNDCLPRDQSDCWWAYLREYLHVYDLDTGTDEALGVIGSFESDYLDVRFGDWWATVTYNPYSAAWACSKLVPAAQLLDTWLDPWPFPTEALDTYGNEITLCDPSGPDPGWATTNTDGSAWMQIVGTWEFPEPWRLVGHDPEIGEELFEVALPDGVGVSWYDFDGTHAVLGTWTQTASTQQDESVFLVDLEGTVTDLDVEGRATIWSSIAP